MITSKCESVAHPPCVQAVFAIVWFGEFEGLFYLFVVLGVFHTST